MSAVILAVIVVMWAVVLVPMWLRRHDAANESRSADRFSTAMRVLSRRNNGSADRRYVLMPRREPAVDVHVSGASASKSRPAGRATRPARPARPVSGRPQPSLAARRRRTLLGLAGLTVLTLILTVAGLFLWPLQLVVDLLMVAFVVHLRMQAKRTAVLARQRSRSGQRAPVPPPTIEPAASELPARRAEEPLTGVEPSVADEPTPVAHPDATPDVAVAMDSDDRHAWEPVPVPRPTYTMKPAAPPRRYAPPAALTEEPPTAPIPAVVAAGDEASELDEILERRRAAGA